MNSLKKLHIWVYVLRSSITLLMLALIGFEIILLVLGSDVGMINQAGMQRKRDQILVKSAYVLAYRPESEKAQAMSDLKTTLPLFEQEQKHLQTINNEDVQAGLQEITDDYLSLIAASQMIIAQPNEPVKLLEVNIIAQHERNYLSGMDDIVLILQQQSQLRTAELDMAQLCIEVVTTTLIIVLMIITYPKYIQMREEQQ